MRTLPILILLSVAALLLLAACAEQDVNPAAPAEAATDKLTGLNDGQGQRAGLDQAFLASLQAAFDSTTWERVQFTEQTRDGAQVAYPKAFEEGQFLQMTVTPGRNSPPDAPEVEVYVPATMGTNPGRCVLFKFIGMVEDAEYVIETFLPVWFEDLDLGPRHHTYELVRGADGQSYEALWVTEYLTPPTPWQDPPVRFTVLGPDPSGDTPGQWILDPDDEGEDN